MVIAAVTLCDVMEVSSDSMAGTIHSGDIIVIDRSAWGLRYAAWLRPRRFQLVVFRRPGEEPQVKRLIGLPGDRVRLLQGQLFINGRQVAEPYVHRRAGYDQAFDSWPRDSEAMGMRDVVVQANHYFLLGDNRERSLDSRDRGMYSEATFVGVVRMIWRRSGSRSE
jgi:signal peptidase I